VTHTLDSDDDDDADDVVYQGERLSHAVGCAFTICLERKQQRDREKAALSGGQDRRGLSPQRTGSFRQTSLAERLSDPQSAIVAGQL